MSVRLNYQFYMVILEQFKSVQTILGIIYPWANKTIS